MRMSDIRIGLNIQWRGTRFMGTGTVTNRDNMGASLSLDVDVQEYHNNSWRNVPSHRLPVRVTLTRADVEGPNLTRSLTAAPVYSDASAQSQINGLSDGTRVHWNGDLFRGNGTTEGMKRGMDKLRVVLDSGSQKKSSGLYSRWVTVNKRIKVLLTGDDIASDKFSVLDGEQAQVSDPMRDLVGKRFFLNGNNFRAQATGMEVRDGKLRTELHYPVLKKVDGVWTIRSATTVRLNSVEIGSKTHVYS